jgi:hypothetical protein
VRQRERKSRRERENVIKHTVPPLPVKSSHAGLLVSVISDLELPLLFSTSPILALLCYATLFELFGRASKQRQVASTMNEMTTTTRLPN